MLANVPDWALVLVSFLSGVGVAIPVLLAMDGRKRDDAPLYSTEGGKLVVRQNGTVTKYDATPVPDPAVSDTGAGS
jgi:hypothetical protein